MPGASAKACAVPMTATWRRRMRSSGVYSRDALRQPLAQGEDACGDKQEEACRTRAGEQHLEEVLEHQPQYGGRDRADEDEPTEASIGVRQRPPEDAAYRTR